ncbi:hypothetical protein [Chelatococcus reniformis]|nr:hypothetical protein [Chelatococcus reniformis]
MSNGSIPMVMGTVAYLKCSEHALRELRESIENALLLAAKTAGSAN